MAQPQRARLALDLGGVAVGVVAPSASALRPLALVLEAFVTGPTSSPRWHILLLDRPALPFDPRLDPPRDGALPEGTPLRSAWGPGGRQLLVDGRLGIRIDYRRRLVVCRLGGAPGLLATTAGIAVLDAILEREGQHLVHAALLALPPALGEGAMLLIGESGAGKSSTALALARGGWALAADDAAVLHDDGAGGVAAWGFPRDLKVHPITAGLLPWLQGLVRPDGDDEVEVSTLALAGLVPLVPEGRRLPIRALAFLGPRGPAHRLVRLGASEAAVRLAAGQLFAPDRRLSSAVSEQFRLMTRLAAGARWRLDLSLGPDLLGLPAWLEATLAR